MCKEIENVKAEHSSLTDTVSDFVDLFLNSFAFPV